MSIGMFPAARKLLLDRRAPGFADLMLGEDAQWARYLQTELPGYARIQCRDERMRRLVHELLLPQFRRVAMSSPACAAHAAEVAAVLRYASGGAAAVVSAAASRKRRARSDTDTNTDIGTAAVQVLEQALAAPIMSSSPHMIVAVARVLTEFLQHNRVPEGPASIWARARDLVDRGPAHTASLRAREVAIFAEIDDTCDAALFEVGWAHVSHAMWQLRGLEPALCAVLDRHVAPAADIDLVQ